MNSLNGLDLPLISLSSNEILTGWNLFHLTHIHSVVFQSKIFSRCGARNSRHIWGALCAHFQTINRLIMSYYAIVVYLFALDRLTTVDGFWVSLNRLDKQQHECWKLTRGQIRLLWNSSRFHLIHASKDLMTQGCVGVDREMTSGFMKSHFLIACFIFCLSFTIT